GDVDLVERAARVHDVAFCLLFIQASRVGACFLQFLGLGQSSRSLALATAGCVAGIGTGDGDGAHRGEWVLSTIVVLSGDLDTEQLARQGWVELERQCERCPTAGNTGSLRARALHVQRDAVVRKRRVYPAGEREPGWLAAVADELELIERLVPAYPE